MAKRGAKQGNQNAAKGNQWKEAIVKALARYESKDKQVERGQALLRIAMKMVEQAIDGDKDARNEIGQRLDGKAVQAIAGPDGKGPVTIEIVRFADTDSE